jgi:hypothetical protein
MRWLKKLACMCIGHKPMVRVDGDLPRMFNPIKFESQITKYSYIVNGAKTPRTQYHYQLFAIPQGSEARVCSRCARLYWRKGLHSGIFCDLSDIPGLQEFKDIYLQILWEQRERRRNDVANKLYKQYLVALKLGADMADDE